MIKSLVAEPFIEGIVYGEGPRWRGDRLWFTDGLAGRVYSVSEAGDLTVEADVERASGLGWLPDGTLVVSALFAAKVHHIGRDGRQLHTFDLSHIAFSTNDLFVDSDGRGYVDLYQAGGSASEAAIGLIEPDGSTRIVATGLAVPNGIARLPGEPTLVVSETNGGRILSFPIHDDGSLGPADVFADLGPGRRPDGLCVDAEDAIWVGCYDTGEFLRVLRGGTVTHRVEIDRGWAVATALGGADGRTLYLMVDDTNIRDLTKGVSTGQIMQTRVDVPGVESP